MNGSDQSVGTHNGVPDAVGTWSVHPIGAEGIIDSARWSSAEGVIDHNKGFERGQSSSHRSPISPFIDFPTLMSKLSTLLPPTEMDLIEKYYNEFRQGNITRKKLVTRLRLLAGDQMLSDIILDHNAERHQVRLSLLDLEASIEERTPDTSTSSRPASGEHNEGST